MTNIPGFTGSLYTITAYKLSTGDLSGVEVPIDSFACDIDVPQEYSMEMYNIVTKNPTTAGTPFTDNVSPMPSDLKIKGLITAYVVRSFLDVLNIPFDIKNALTQKDSYLNSRIAQFYNILNSGYFFKVKTPFNIFNRMVLNHSRFLNTLKATNALYVELDFQDVFLSGDIQSPTQNQNSKNNVDRDPVNQGIKNG